jgi:hypothetical protein
LMISRRSLAYSSMIRKASSERDGYEARRIGLIKGDGGADHRHVKQWYKEFQILRD